MKRAAGAALVILVAAGCGGSQRGGLAVRQFRFGTGAQSFVVVVQRGGTVVARGSGPLRLRLQAGRYRVVARRGARHCALNVDVHGGRTTEIQVAVVAAGCTLADELPE